MKINLVSIPEQDGAGRMGCEMGPGAYRTAGIAASLSALGHEALDFGTVVPGPIPDLHHSNSAIRNLGAIAAWTEAIARAAYAASADAFPIFMGGDHAISAGTLAGVARRAEEAKRPLFVLWLDAHPDFHTLQTTSSGNLHGVPLAYACGLDGFEGFFPPLAVAMDPKNVCALGIRSVDPEEHTALAHAGVTVHDMRAIDEHGIGVLLERFLSRVEAAEGMLHVSLDVDFLDPAFAPAVGTSVPGGATLREAHLAMEILSDCELVTSLDLVELNPFLDDRGKTASVMVDLAASLLGKRILDRPTQAFARSP